ncbi:sensor histidine kinase [Nonomuraea glycinis]|uniref:sensor histidine kinase n=1 Tax=Nonomuraea glycinis TaxID=2047744 RepID=UPI0033BE7875
MQADGVPLRRRVLTVIVGVTALAVVLFTVPLAFAVNLLYRDEAVAALQRDATWIAATIPDDARGDPARPLRLPVNTSNALAVGIYTPSGARLVGAGPARSHFVTGAKARESVEDGFLTVVAPVPSDESTSMIVRVATPYERVEQRVHQAWLLMSALGLVVIALAAAVAVRQSKRLAAPLERLTAAAQTLGGGDFSIRTSRSGMREADQAGQALEATARRLGDVLARERAFSADVSHQLRTGLTGLLLGLESALARPAADLQPVIHAALERGERLREVIDDLVRLSRDSRPHGALLNVPELMEELRADWHGPLAEQGRRLTITVEPDLAPVPAQSAAVRQILRVLLDNALRHGHGEVSVTVADVGPGLAIEVGDQGPGIGEDQDPFARASGQEHGIGLALARSLAEAEGGRLLLRRAAPPLFSLLLPAHTS